MADYICVAKTNEIPAGKGRTVEIAGKKSRCSTSMAISMPSTTAVSTEAARWDKGRWTRTS